MTDTVATTDNNDAGARHSQRFPAKDLRLEAVTVFTDRAEVKRSFELKLEAGWTDIVIEVSPGENN